METSFLQILSVHAHWARSSNAPNVQGHALPNLLRQCALGKDIRNGNSSTGLQQTENFVEDELLLFFWDKIDDAVGDDAVCDAVLESNMRDLRLDELDVVLAGGSF